MNEIVINPINTYLKKAVFSKAAASSRFLNWWNNFFNRAHLKGILHFRSSWTTWLINYRSFRFSEPSGIRILLWRLTVRVRVKTCTKSRDIKIRIIRKLVVITPVVVVAVVLNHPISALRLSMMKLGPILQQANAQLSDNSEGNSHPFLRKKDSHPITSHEAISSTPMRRGATT